MSRLTEPGWETGTVAHGRSRVAAGADPIPGSVSLGASNQRKRLAAVPTVTPGDPSGVVGTPPGAAGLSDSNQRFRHKAAKQENPACGGIPA